MKTLPTTNTAAPPMNAPRCPRHDKPMIYVGRVPAWEDRREQAHGWHCAKCSLEIQFPITLCNRKTP